MDILSDEECENLMKSVNGCTKVLATSISAHGIDSQVSSSDIESTQSHVMLSYNFSTRDLVRELKNNLNKAGFPTWMDEESLVPGSLLDTLETAVRNAILIIICFSAGYKRSPFCRMEAEYALKLKKRIVYVRAERGYVPDGWLAFLMGQSLYYDLSAAPEKVAKLIKDVRALCEEVQVPSGPASAGGHGTELPPGRLEQKVVSHLKELHAHSVDAVVPKETCMNWTGEQVQDWLKQKELHFLLDSYAFQVSFASELSVKL